MLFSLVGTENYLINNVMIILRQKEHSSKLMKVVRTVKRAGNNVMTAIDNAGLKVGNTAKEIVTGKPTPAHMKVKFRPKTSQQINRETVQQVRGVQKSANQLKDAAIMDPGGTAGTLANKYVIQRATKSPVSAVMPLAPVPGATSTSIVVAPYEQKLWDGVNKVGVGKYTVGNAIKPVKKFVRTTVNNNAANIGRAAYNQIGLML